jgi:hypothetical protein
LALEALYIDPTHLRHCDDFVSAMVYGEKIEFVAAFATVTELAETMIRSARNKT